ncbi:MAG: cob(I)yrinic acid a,c-diamide adenosyltransferase [Bacteroidota bacterium]
MSESGLVHIYTGEGKGKTTSAVGLGIRALSHGMKVCYSYFNKKPSFYGTTEVSTLEGLGATIVGEENQLGDKVVYDSYFDANQDNFKSLKRLISDNDFDMLIMDEILISVGSKLIDEDSVIDFIKNKPKKLELVLTGRNATDKLIDMADYVSYIQMMKHPFERGQGSREGIEY